jgi:hypothetical protein
MNTTPFIISYRQNGIEKRAEIRPCCREDSIVDYAVYTNGRLNFTITRNVDHPKHWVIAMKNADEEIGEDAVQSIGAEIDKIKRN